MLSNTLVFSRFKEQITRFIVILVPEWQHPSIEWQTMQQMGSKKKKNEWLKTPCTSAVKKQKITHSRQKPKKKKIIKKEHKNDTEMDTVI